jgi:hypothetical protein
MSDAIESTSVRQFSTLPILAINTGCGDTKISELLILETKVSGLLDFNFL